MAANTAPPLSERVRPWLLFALVALLVARPLLPSEGVSWIGDGQPFAMLTICLAGAYFALAMLEGGFPRRLNLADAAVAGLVGLCVVAAMVGASSGSPRNSINMLFEWLSLGLLFFLARWLVRTPRETRALVAIMVSLAVVMAAYGFHQVLIGLPQARAQYAENPDEALRAADQWYPPDSSERRQFEDRLASSEPLATFALTNSLAGFLAPWIVIAIAILANQFRGRFGSSRAGDNPSVSKNRGWLARAAGMAVLVVAMIGCLVLTKSRSAYVAVGIGVLLLPLFDAQLRRRLFSKRLAMAVGAVLVLVVVGAVAVGGLDREVLTEAGKSLGYRLEYWRSTMGMIGAHPWLGVGPGNFQDYYTEFKLPQASEEIRDPHNFLFEVWATAGTFALVALAEALVVFAWRTWNIDRGEKDPSDAGPVRGARRGDVLGAGEAPHHVALMAAGGVVGFVLAFLIGPSVGLEFSEQKLIGGLLVGAVALALMWPWVSGGALSPRLPALGLLVLAIHLLAAGGIATAGVAGTFWVLLALGLNETDAAGDAAMWRAPRGRLAWLGAAGLAAACAAAVACYQLSFGPVVRNHAAMLRAADERQSTDKRINLLLEAAEADPLSADPWWAIAEQELTRLKKKPHEEAWKKRFVKVTAEMLERRPHSSATWRQAGRWFYELYTYDHDANTAQAAAESLRLAVRLYPNLAELRGEYALALSAGGDLALARRQADIARRMDRQTPHADKKLSPQLREQLEKIRAASPHPALQQR